MRTFAAVALLSLIGLAEADTPSLRPPAEPSKRPAATGPNYFVDPQRGDDQADGSAKAPWKTLSQAITRLRAGDTLNLFGGVYYETLDIQLKGTATAPITIRSAPGHVAILDGGHREFAESPATAWAPVPGSPDEFISVRSFAPTRDEGATITAHVASSMVPLHGYRWGSDLRSKNEYWNLPKNDGPDSSVYVGPGVWRDPQNKLHVRLAATTLTSQPRYMGSTDARKIALVIATGRGPLRIERSAFLRLQDLVLRGATASTLSIANSEHIDLEAMTIYGGAPAMSVRSTNYLKLSRSSLRGLSAPWSSRASMKYRSNSPYLFVAETAQPQSHDWELSYNEFTDGHDGVVIDGLKTLRFHHNLLENFNDDGIYLTLLPRHNVPIDIYVYENVFRRIYTAIAFAGPSTGEVNPIGTGVYMFRNVFDLRNDAYIWPAKDATQDRAPARTPSRLIGDHGSPIWEPLFFYQNTVLSTGNAWRDFYGAGIIVSAQGSSRRVFNNIFVRDDGDPGIYFKGQSNADLQVDGDLLWGKAKPPNPDFFDTFRNSDIFADSKRSYPPGWTSHCVYGDPQFTRWSEGKDLDLSLRPGSPAIDAGVPLPTTWPDSLRRKDRGKPDIGASPLGSSMVQVGPRAP